MAIGVVDAEGGDRRLRTLVNRLRRVLPGGADRQLQRADGARQLQALYEMRCNDGTVLTIDNQVIIDETEPGKRYAMSHLRVTAPQGPHDWLNRRIVLGTLQPLRPAMEAVLIRSYLVDS